MRINASKFRHLLLLCTALSAAGAYAQELEPLEHIEDAARGFARQRLPAPDSRQRLLVGPIDKRLQLPRCAHALKAQIGPGTVLRDRLLVEVSCTAAPAWRTFIPARLVGIGRAVALKRPMMAGQRLTADDLTMIEADAAQFPLGYYDDPARVAGASLRRASAGGMILTNQLLLSADGIVRGQAVTVLAHAGGVAVRMSGRAISEGGINQRIKVRNDSSGKVIEGIARSQQVVEINP